MGILPLFDVLNYSHKPTNRTVKYAGKGGVVMVGKLAYLWLGLLLAGLPCPCPAADTTALLSVAKPGGSLAPASKALPTRQKTKAASSTPAKSQSPQTSAPSAAAKASAEPSNGEENEQAQTAPPPPSTSQLLSQAYQAYKSNPQPAGLQEVLRLFKQLISQAGPRIPAAALIKSTPVLSDMGVKALDALAGRVFVFSRLPDPQEIVMQWPDTKTTITYVGRRHRRKKVTATTTWRVGGFILPADITLSDARILGTAEGKHSVILVGSEGGSKLWLKTFKQTEGGWAETASRLDSIPAFLTNNVSGRVIFRGPDLIFNIGRVVSSKVSGAPSALPEAESATYRFWLHYTDQGYVLMSQLPDEAQFGIVRAFLEAIANARTEVAKSLLSDSRLLSIPKYVGIHGPSPEFKVAQTASPPSGAARFRLVTGGKDDLIFEVGRVKDRTAIRAIFIAPPDPFLQEMAGHLPKFDQVAPGSTLQAVQPGSEKH